MMGNQPPTDAIASHVLIALLKYFAPERPHKTIVSLRTLGGRLCLNQDSHEGSEIGWVYIAHSDHAQVACRGGLDGES